MPQNDVPSIRIGATAAIVAPEYPGRTFAASIEASSRSVDAASGTTLCSSCVDNADGALMPGGYASVHFDLLGAAGSFRVPAAALIFDRAACASPPSTPTTASR